MRHFIQPGKDIAATLRFISENEHGQPAVLALKAANSSLIDVNFAVNQIQGRQLAQKKLPLWHSTPGIVYPPHISMEQCSSQFTAAYKAGLVVGDSFTDLTGGFGVDFSFMARNAKRATYVERNPELCRIAGHNLPLLGLQHASVHCCDATEFAGDMTFSDTVFIDPARRDKNGSRVFALGDCEPNLTALIPILLSKSRRIIAKLSPMLDLTAIAVTLPQLTQLHIVSTGNECKEILAVIEPGEVSPLLTVCVNDTERFAFSSQDKPQPAAVWNEDPTSAIYLYEPNSALMKAGCFDHIAHRFAAIPISRQSHFFVADRIISDFPGRKFRITGITSMNKKELRKALGGITCANITCRNFPLKANELAKRLKLRDGGGTYLFATALAQGKLTIFITKKVTDK